MQSNDSREKKHVAFYIPSLEVGGAEKVIVTLANKFSQKYTNVDLVLARAHGPLLSLLNPNVRVVDLATPRVLLSFIPLARYLRRTKPDAMLSALNYANIVAVFARIISKANVKLFVSEHSNTYFYFKSSPIKKRIIKFLMHSYRFSDGIIAVSDGVKLSLSNTIRLPPSRIHRIYNPIYNEKNHSSESCEPPKSKTTKKRIITVCRLTKAKDLSTLIKAFKIASDKVDSELIIIGGGEEYNNLVRIRDDLKLNNKVTFTGFLSNPWSFAKTADLFVLSSAWEGFGNVLVEAMSHGLPIVATNCRSGPSEILEGGKWGNLVPVGDAVALAEAIVQSLDFQAHPNVRERARFFSVQRSFDLYDKIMLDDN